MANIMLFGSTDLTVIPSTVQDWVAQYNQQEGINFIVGDKNGIDASFHRLLSAAGALRKSKVYYLDTIKNNKYEIDTMPFKSDYNAEAKRLNINDNVGQNLAIVDGIEKEMDVPYTRDYYEFIDRKLIDDSDMALCVWDGSNKRIFHMIQLMNIKNKPCYSFVV